MSPLRSPIRFETTFAVYTATEIAGEGGNGIVYKATDAAGEEVAVKLLSARSASREQQKRFKNELLFGMNARHPNVVRVIDHGLHRQKGLQPAPFYVMPFYSGSLRTLMRKRIPPDHVLRVFAQLLDGAEAAHKMGVIHRDLKPENILHDSARQQLVVADFGIAEFAQEELYTLIETRPGTRLANFTYAAPEQRQRGATCDHRTDIFALGLVLNEMFTSAVPQGTGYKLISSVAPELAYLDDIVGLMIRQNLAERPTSIDAIKSELIGRRNDFVTRQELSSLSKQVVPTGTIDDPLIADPIRVVDAWWDNGTLTIKLSQPVNQLWIQVLQSNYSRTSIMNRGPETHRVVGDQASVSVESHDAQRAIDYFKSWLPYVEAMYKRKVEQRIEQERSAMREQLAREIRLREEKLAVNSSLRV
jgi:serine/threonine protein kinase